MRERLQLSYRTGSLILLAWLLSLWILYWSGYWNGFVTSMRSEYAYTSASTMSEIEQLKAITRAHPDLDAIKKAQMASIETNLETLSGTKKLLDDKHHFVRQFAYSLYETPRMAFALASDRPTLADVPEIEKKYRDVVKSTTAKKQK